MSDNEIKKEHYDEVMNSSMKLGSYANILENLVACGGLPPEKIKLDEYLLTLSLDIQSISKNILNSVNKLEI